MMQKNWQNKSQKAQGMVEFALVLPILLMIILAIFAFGHFMFAYITTVSASREAARYGSAVGPSENGIARFEDCKAIRDSAIRVGSIAGMAAINIYYDDGSTKIEDCSGDRLSNPDNVGLGDRIVVEVTTNYTPIVPMVNLPSFPIYSRSTRTILRAAPVGTAAVAMPVQSEEKENTNLTITSDNPDYSKVGVPVDVYFTMTHTGTGAAPTGNVTIIGSDDQPGDGNDDVTCVAALDAGHCAITPDTPGPWTITATYAGDSAYNGSQDIESHQVYYLTAVSVASMDPNPSILGVSGEVTLGYSITTDPAVTGSYKPQKLQVFSDDKTACDVTDPGFSGSCKIAAYDTGGTKVITMAIAGGDPYFIQEAAYSTNYQVNAGYDTATMITAVDFAGGKTSYNIGDTVRVWFQVAQPAGVADVPAGTVNVTESTALLQCNGGPVTIDASGKGSCDVTITSRGTSAMMTLRAAFTPADRYLWNSSTGTFDISVNKLTPTISVEYPQSLTEVVIRNSITIKFRVSSADVPSLVPGGGVTVNVNGISCFGQLSGGYGECAVTLSSAGTYAISFDYDGNDPNYNSASLTTGNLINVVDNCPKVVYQGMFNSDGQQPPQLIFSVTNPKNADVSIQQVNTSWPYNEGLQNIYMSYLYLTPVNGNASSFSCNTGAGCLWKHTGSGGGSLSTNSNTISVFSSATTQSTCEQFVTDPVGTCLEWINKSVATVPANGTSYLYLVLSVNPNITGTYNVNLRTSDESCKWVHGETYVGVSQ